MSVYHRYDLTQDNLRRARGNVRNQQPYDEDVKTKSRTSSLGATIDEDDCKRFCARLESIDLLDKIGCWVDEEHADSISANAEQRRTRVRAPERHKRLGPAAAPDQYSSAFTGLPVVLEPGPTLATASNPSAKECLEKYGFLPESNLGRFEDDSDYGNIFAERSQPWSMSSKPWTPKHLENELKLLLVDAEQEINPTPSVNDVSTTSNKIDYETLEPHQSSPKLEGSINANAADTINADQAIDAAYSCGSGIDFELNSELPVDSSEDHGTYHKKDFHGVDNVAEVPNSCLDRTDNSETHANDSCVKGTLPSTWRRILYGCIAPYKLRGHVECAQNSRSAQGATTTRGETSITSKPSTTQNTNYKRPRRTLPNEGSDKEDSEEQPSKHGSPKLRVKDHKLACPFPKRYPLRYHRCRRLSFRNTSDLKVHLRTCHYDPVYCSRCGKTFHGNDASNAKLEHLEQEIRCEKKPENTAHFDGIKVDRQKDIPTYVPRGNQCQAYMLIYKAIFPDAPPPDNPYCNDLDMLAYEQLALSHGHDKHSIEAFRPVFQAWITNMQAHTFGTRHTIDPNELIPTNPHSKTSQATPALSSGSGLGVAAYNCAPSHQQHVHSTPTQEVPGQDTVVAGEKQTRPFGVGYVSPGILPSETGLVAVEDVLLSRYDQCVSLEFPQFETSDLSNDYTGPFSDELLIDLCEDQNYDGF